MKQISGRSLCIAQILLAAILFSNLSFAQVPNRDDANVHHEAGLPADNLRLLTGRAALIFKGVVSAIEYETDAETDLPYTYVTFRQIEPIKDLSGEFVAGTRDKLRVRLFGGLKEDGTMTVVSHVPSFTLGAVYLVFYTGGEWDVSPVVGGERGVFQILKSRTLGYEILLDAYGNVVVGMDDQRIETLPLRTQPDARNVELLGSQEGAPAAEQTDQIQVDRDTIYTEENVRRLMQEGEGAERSLQKEEPAATPQDSTRSRILQGLAKRPISLDGFIQRIVELDRAHAEEFRPFYSNIRLEGNPVQREKTPVGPTQE